MAAGIAAIVHCDLRPFVHSADDMLVVGILDDAAASVFSGGAGMTDPGYLPAEYTENDAD